MLMALVSANRSHELCSLKLSLMQDLGNVVTFTITKLTKTRKMGSPPTELSFSQYTNNELLDVVACLRQYLEVSSLLRKSAEQKQNLFVAFVIPHKPVAPCTVARWLRLVMQGAKIDIDKFKAHSVRAATSKAANLGLSTTQVMERANWTKASTFNRFYHKQVTDQFQDKVLDM